MLLIFIDIQQFASVRPEMGTYKTQGSKKCEDRIANFTGRTQRTSNQRITTFPDLTSGYLT